MRLRDVNAVDLTEWVDADSDPDVAPDATASEAARSIQDSSEPLLLTQEVPLELLAREFDDGEERAAPTRALVPGGWTLPHLWHIQRMRRGERRHAERTTRALVARFRDIVARYPDLGYRDTLKLLVMEHTRCDAVSAARILANAENSFASWPSDRDLNLADVAHYISVSEFLALHRAERGIRSDIGALVAALVPRELLHPRQPTAPG